MDENPHLKEIAAGLEGGLFGQALFDFGAWDDGIFGGLDKGATDGAKENFVRSRYGDSRRVPLLRNRC